MNRPTRRVAPYATALTLTLAAATFAALPARAQIRNAPSPRALEFAAYIFAASKRLRLPHRQRGFLRVCWRSRTFGWTTSSRAARSATASRPCSR